jgi:hypothetical protein
MRTTARLRRSCGRAVADGGRTVAQAGRDHGLSWPVAHRELAAYAAEVLPEEPEPAPVIGIDEIRRGRPVWEQDPGTGKWRLAVDRWHVGFVDITGGQGLLGQVEGRNAEAVAAWLAARSDPWRRAVGHVAIDMCAVFRAAIRRALPHAIVVVDHFHVVQLANAKLAELRRRLTWRMRGRRGRSGDDEWQARELVTLAQTIQAWWNEIEAFIATGISNAKSEGINRVIKLEARNAYGFRNPHNQRLRSRCDHPRLPETSHPRLSSKTPNGLVRNQLLNWRVSRGGPIKATRPSRIAAG